MVALVLYATTIPLLVLDWWRWSRRKTASSPHLPFSSSSPSQMASLSPSPLTQLNYYPPPPPKLLMSRLCYIPLLMFLLRNSVVHPRELMTITFHSLKEHNHLVATHIDLVKTLLASPVMPVKKHESTWQFCVDYCAINQLTTKDKYLNPFIIDLVYELMVSHSFPSWTCTSVTTKFGWCLMTFWRPQSAHGGDYEYLVMSCGLTNAFWPPKHLWMSSFALA